MELLGGGSREIVRAVQATCDLEQGQLDETGAGAEDEKRSGSGVVEPTDFLDPGSWYLVKEFALDPTARKCLYQDLNPCLFGPRFVALN